MPKIIVEIEWNHPDAQLNVLDISYALHADIPGTEFVVRESMLSASESLFGFTGWLTSRAERTVMSSADEAGCIADLVGRFCAANHLTDPREGWCEVLVYPEEIERTPGFPTISESFVEQNRLEEIE